MEKFERNEIIVGLFVLVSMAVLLVAVVVMGGHGNIFETRFEIVGVWQNVAGLRPGAEVRLGGKQVGEVKVVEFRADNKVAVTMSILSSVRPRVGPDSMGTISTEGLLGDKIVNLTPGTPTEGPKRFEIVTDEPRELGDLVAQAAPSFQDLSVILTNLRKVSQAFTDPDSDYTRIVRNLTHISDDLSSGRGTLGALLTDEGLRADVAETIRTVNSTVDRIGYSAEKFQEASQKLPGLLDGADRTVNSIDSTFSELSQLLESGSKVMANVEQASADLPEFMTAARKSAENAEGITSNILTATKNAPDLVKSTQRGVEEVTQVATAAKKSWFLRGNLGAESAEKLIGLEERAGAYNGQ